MLQTHIVNLQVGERAILQCLLDSQTRVIGMYVHLDYVIVCHTYNRIADGLQIRLEIHFHLDIEGLVQHDDEFRAIAELNLHLRLGLPLAFLRAHFCLLAAYGLDGQVQLLAQEGVEGP